MKAAALALLAAASLGLTALRYGSAGDADAAFLARLIARLADADVLLVDIEKTPAFQTLRLRRIGCLSLARLAFAPNDGEADAALRRLLPDAVEAVAPGTGPLRPGWLIRLDAGETRGCVAAGTLRAVALGADG